MADEDPYLREHKHPFRLFVANINKYVEDQGLSFEEPAEPPSDCRHAPRCTSDGQHTDRKARDRFMGHV